METYQRVVAATHAHGKFAGAGGNRDVKRQLEAISLGIQFITTNSDIRFLMRAAAEWTGSIRTALAGETPTASSH